MTYRSSLVAVACLCGLMLASAAPADTVSTAKGLYEKSQDSVLWVLAVVKIEASAGGQTAPAQEKKVEALGTILDKSGLTVVSYSSLDPSMAASGRKVRTRQGTVTLDVKAEFKEVKLRLTDGTEVPASLVLTDKDLDLGFILPNADSDEAKDATFTPIPATPAGKLGVLDEVIAIGRLGKSLDRRPTVQLGRIAATVKKPRPFYRTTAGFLGGPVFDARGKFVGLAVRKIVNGRPSSPVVLPARDLADSAKQAKAKAPAKTPAKAPAKDSKDK